MLDKYYIVLSDDLKEELDKHIETLKEELDKHKTELDDYTLKKIEEIKNACEGLTDIAKNKLWKADTIEDLKNMIFLTAGDIVEVLGYYQADDGAMHKRLIDQADDGSGILLDNGLYANIVHNGIIDISWVGAKNNGIDDSSEFVNKIQSISKNITIQFSKGNYKVNSHLIIRNKIKVEQAIFVVDWTPNSWLTIYSNNNQSILPEWFGIVYGKTISEEQAKKNCQAIQSALNTAIDISIDKIGVVANPNHGQYNSVKVVFDGGKEYYIGNNTIKMLSEHHFLGVEMTSSVPYKYLGGIIGDGKGTLISIEKAKNTSEDGAHTCKFIRNLCLSECNIAIDAAKADQSIYITDNRFNTCKEAVIRTNENFCNIVKNNQFISCGGGYLYIGNYVNQSIICNNTVDESTVYSKGIKIIPGTTLGGINISGNVMRDSGIEIESSAVIEKPVVTISNNHLLSCSNKNFNSVIKVGEKIINPVIKDNIITYGNKQESSVDFIGIDVVNGEILSNYVYGKFDIGVSIKNGGRCTSIVRGAKVGIRLNNRDFSVKKSLIVEPYVHNCETGIDNNSINSSIINGIVENCSTIGIQGGDDFRSGVLKGVTFKGNTKDYRLYQPGIARLGEWVIPQDCVFLDSEYTYKIRGGVGLNAHLYIDGSIAPTGGKWRVGDIIETSSGYKFICTQSGTPGSWRTVLNPAMNQLNTYYMSRKMEKEGVLQDFDTYMDEKTAYDKRVEKFEKDKQLAYEEELKYNPDLSYEEFTETYEKLNIVMLPSYEGEPQPSEALKMFMEKYL